jgi:hypothetical protein
MAGATDLSLKAASGVRNVEDARARIERALFLDRYLASGSSSPLVLILVIPIAAFAGDASAAQHQIRAHITGEQRTCTWSADF